MIPLDLPPKLWTPPALVIPGQAETLDRALARDGVPRSLRRAIEREIARSLGARSKDVLARVSRDHTEASMPVLLALLAARRRAQQVLSVEVGGSDGSTADGQTYTFTSVPIGTAQAGRRVLVAFALQDNGTSIELVSATIGGNVAAILTQNGTGDRINTGFFILQVDAGTTATIVLNGVDLNSYQDCYIQAYAVYGMSASAAADTGGVRTGTATNPSDSIDCPAGGIIFGAAGWRDTADVDTTWTNLATEDFDAFNGDTLAASFAHESFASVQTGRTITATASQAPLNNALSLVSLGL